MKFMLADRGSPRIAYNRQGFYYLNGFVVSLIFKNVGRVPQVRSRLYARARVCAQSGGNTDKQTRDRL